MAEPAEALKTEPESDVTFEGPFTSPVNMDLKVTNPEEKRIAFKVKCTNNSRFRIKPVVGFLKGGESTTIRLTCQPFELDPEKPPKERFVLFSLYAEDESVTSPKAFWTSGTCGDGRRKNFPVTFKAAAAAAPAAEGAEDHPAAETPAETPPQAETPEAKEEPKEGGDAPEEKAEE